MATLRPVRLAALLILCGVSVAGWGAPPIQVQVPRTALGPGELAVIVNDADPLSRRIGAYYARWRRIPADNVIHIRFPPGRPVMSPHEFRALRAVVEAITPKRVQAYALTWAAPYRVGCMSITTAFAAGYDPLFCAAGCRPTRFNPYFDSDSRHPYRDFGIRPTMALAGTTFAAVKALIDRGIAADHTFPGGTAYLVSTGDKARNVRARFYPRILRTLRGHLRAREVHTDYLTHRDDILFYFTGRSTVPGLDTDRFLPGAIADHLTSTGGALTTTHQMSSLRWLEAGATASYGTVVEPCNFLEKFPNPGIVIRRYLQGEPLIEAYWKSVAWPGQGIFIGAPLARPFGAYRIVHRAGGRVLDLEALPAGHRYRLLAAPGRDGPYHVVRMFTGTGWPSALRLPRPVAHAYRVVAAPAVGIAPLTGPRP